MKEQVKVTFLIDKEVLNNTAKGILKESDKDTILQSIAILGAANLLAKNNVTFNTIDLSEIKNQDAINAFVEVAGLIIVEYTHMKGEGYATSIFGKDGQK